MGFASVNAGETNTLTNTDVDASAYSQEPNQARKGLKNMDYLLSSLRKNDRKI